jgi:hypothetical protein
MSPTATKVGLACRREETAYEKNTWVSKEKIE